MNEFEQIYKRWRKKLLQTNLILTIMVTFIEILMSFILKKMNLIEQPRMEYVRIFLLSPILTNFLILIIGNIVMKYIQPNYKYINYIPIVQMALICLVLASTHNIFSVTLCLLCFPLFTTIMFSDKKMTRIIGILCFLFLLISLLFRKFSAYRPKDDKYFLAEAIVSVGILAATFILSNVLIAFAEEKTNIINQGYLKQIEMKELLNRDQKTGLFGHTIFIHTLNRMVEDSNRTHKLFALAVIDIDDFKKVNDTYGHLKGDQIIHTLTDLMKKYFIEDQFIARYGGEEFVIILSEEELVNGIGLLEEFRKAFELQKYSFMKETITISIGIATWKQGWTSEQLFEAADAAMYSSKSAGKNRITEYGN